MNPAPVVRRISWPAVLPQLAALGGAVALGTQLVGPPNGVTFGAAAYLIYSFGSRMVIARDHRRGMRLFHGQQYGEAIAAFTASYDFFTRHSWVDKLRSVTLMSPSAMSYREMALCNIAFCHAQLGDGAKARITYQKALAEFPGSGLAEAALRLIDAVSKPATEHPGEPQGGPQSAPQSARLP